MEGNYGSYGGLGPPQAVYFRHLGMDRAGGLSVETGGDEVSRSPLCRSSHGVEVETGFVEVVDLGGRVSKR